LGAKPLEGSNHFAPELPQGGDFPVKITLLVFKHRDDRLEFA
jgi:hypothetical protein